MSLQQGLVGHWTMNDEDTSGGTIYDKSAYNNHGTINGASPGQAGIVGQSFNFDGNDDYIVTNYLGPYDTNTFAISAWFKINLTTSADYSTIVDNYDGSYPQVSIQYNENGNGLDFRLHDGNESIIISAGTQSGGVWIHGVLVRDKNEAIIYVNGKEEGRNSNASLNTNLQNSNIQIGERPDGNGSMDGQIADVRLYDRALSESEVNQLYNKRTTTNTIVNTTREGLVGHWTMDDLQTSGGEIADNSGNGYSVSIGSNATTGEPGIIGQSCLFDDSTDCLRSTENKQNVTGLSVSTWIKPEGISVSYPGVVTALPQSGSNDFSDGFTMQLYSSNNALDVESRDLMNPSHAPNNSATTFGDDLSFDEWIHWVWIYNESNGDHKFFVDGEEAISFSGNSSQSIDMYRLSIGERYYSGSYRQPFDGNIDDVRIYNRTLSQDEIRQLYEMKYEQRPTAVDSLSAWYPFDAAGAIDQSGNGNDGTVNGATFQSNARGNKGAYYFDGSDHIQTGFDKDKNSFSYMAWAKPNNVSGRNDIIDSIESSSSNWARIDVRNSEAGFVNDVNSSKTRIDSSGNIISTGKWYHICGVRDGSTGDMTLYVNADQKNSGSNDSSVIPHTNNERIGESALGSGENFNGEISDVRIYDKALSQKEIQLIYDKTK